MSGLETIQSDCDQPVTRRGGNTLKNKSSSFVDPFDISIEITTDEEDTCSSIGSDEDYEPSVNITIGPTKAEELEKVTFNEVEFGAPEEDDNTDAEDDDSADIPGKIRILSPENQSLLTDDQLHLVYQQPLLNLARLQISSLCNVNGCCESVELLHESV